MGAAIAHMGYCNKMPQTGYLINNRNVLLTVLEVQKCKIRVPARLGLVRTPVLAVDCLLPMASLHGGGGKGAHSGLCYKGVYYNSTYIRVSSSGPNYLPKVLPRNTTTLGIRFQHMNLGEGHKRSDCQDTKSRMCLCFSFSHLYI